MSDRRNAGFTIIDLLVILAVLIVLSTIVFFIAGPMYRKSKIAKDRNNIAGLSKSLFIWADQHGGVFPHKETSTASIKQLVIDNIIPNGKIFDCPAFVKLTEAQTHENVDKKSSKLFNQYYTYSNIYMIKTSTRDTFCVGDADMAWEELTIVGKCDGTTQDYYVVDDPYQPKDPAQRSVKNMHHPKRSWDQIYSPNPSPKGTVDTFLVPASTDTSWFKSSPNR